MPQCCTKPCLRLRRTHVCGFTAGGEAAGVGPLPGGFSTWGKVWPWPWIPAVTIYGKLGGWGLIAVDFPPRCPNILPFNLEGQVGAFVSVGVQVPGLGDWDLAKLSIWIGVRNIWVKAR